MPSPLTFNSVIKCHTLNIPAKTSTFEQSFSFRDEFACERAARPPDDDSFSLNLDKIDVSQVVLRGSAGKCRRNKQTKKALASLEAFSKRLIEDDKVILF